MQRSFDITLAGELNLDLILYGLPPKMALERELLASGFSMTLGSSSAILAHHLAVLGFSVGFQSLVGDDAMGRLARERLQGAGVDTKKVAVAKDGTGTGITVLLPHADGRHILTYSGTIATLSYADLDSAYLARARHFHLSSFFLQQGLRPHVADLFRAMRSAGLTVSLDTNDDPEDRWEGLEEVLPLVDVLLPNAAEACRMTGCRDLGEAVDQLAAVVPVVAVKCGAEGALVAQELERARVPGIVVQPVDTIGAGDSFNAGFLAGYIDGRDAVQSAMAGVVCGALSTLRPGGVEAFDDAALRESFLAEHGPAWLLEKGDRAS